MAGSRQELLTQIAEAEARLRSLDRERAEARVRLRKLHEELAASAHPPSTLPVVASGAPTTPAEKVSLFRALFRGRADVFPARFVSAKTGNAGYAPACANKFVRGVCGLPRVKCGDCPNQAFVSVTDQAVLDHLRGRHVMGVYRPNLDAESGNTRRVRRACVQVRAREAQQVAGLDNHPEFRDRVDGFGWFGDYGDGLPGGNLATLLGSDLLQVPVAAGVLDGATPVGRVESDGASWGYRVDRGPPVRLRVHVGRPGVAVEAQLSGPATRMFLAVGGEAQVQPIPEGTPQVHAGVPQSREE
jgi:hypothetical protein